MGLIAHQWNRCHMLQEKVIRKSEKGFSDLQKRGHTIRSGEGRIYRNKFMTFPVVERYPTLRIRLGRFVHPRLLFAENLTLDPHESANEDDDGVEGCVDGPIITLQSVGGVSSLGVLTEGVLGSEGQGGLAGTELETGE